MADHYSTELASVNWEGDYRTAFVNPTVMEGRQRIVSFSVSTDTLKTASYAAGDDIIVGIIPAGARLLPGDILTDDVNATELIVGLRAMDGTGYLSKDGSTLADDPNGLTSTVIDADTAATQSRFGHLNADPLGLIVLEKPAYLTIRLNAAAAALAASAHIRGWMGYVKD